MKCSREGLLRVLEGVLVRGDDQSLVGGEHDAQPHALELLQQLRLNRGTRAYGCEHEMHEAVDDAQQQRVEQQRAGVE